MRQRGAALLMLMVALLLLSIAGLGVVTVERLERERDREAELLRHGEQLRNALVAYRNLTPTEPKRYPVRLEELIEDRRFPTPVRHLRRIPPDPFVRPESRAADTATHWGLVLQGDQIVGVHSLSSRTPLRRSGFLPLQRGFEQARSVSDWRFIASPDVPRSR